MNTPMLPKRGERVANSKKRGLSVRSLFNARGRKNRMQRSIKLGGKEFCASVERGAKDGFSFVKTESHPLILRPLTRKQERDFRSPFRCLEGPNPCLLLTARERSKALSHIFQIVCLNRKAGRKCASCAERVREIGEFDFRRARDECCEFRSLISQRGGALRGDRDNGRLRGVRGRPHPFIELRSFFENDVRIGPAEAKGADSRPPRMFTGGPWTPLSYDFDREEIPRHVRVQRGGVKTLRQLGVLKG